MIGMDGGGRGRQPKGSRVLVVATVAVCSVFVCTVLACSGRRQAVLPELPSPEQAVFVMRNEESFFSVFKNAMGLDGEESAARRASLTAAGEGMEPSGNGEEPVFSEWMQQLQRQAVAGDDKARFWYGRFLVEDARDPLMEKEGIRWLEMAAGNGFLRAQLYLGMMYANPSVGGPVNIPLAQKWLEKAASRNSPMIQLYLGLLYGQGKVLPRDADRSLYWTEKASDGGLAMAQFAQGLMRAFLEGYPHDEARAADCFGKAAKQGLAKAQFYLARMYWEGRGVPKSDVEAVHWNVLAAEQGLPEAEFAMGQMAWQGIGVRQDRAWSLMWIDRAAHHGLPEAQYVMGQAYLKGEGVDRAVVTAAAWFYRAAMQGHVASQLRLAYMYANGIGVESNRERAALWLEKAAATGDEQANRWLTELETGKRSGETGAIPLFSRGIADGFIRLFSGAVLTGPGLFVMAPEQGQALRRHAVPVPPRTDTDFFEDIRHAS